MNKLTKLVGAGVGALSLGAMTASAAVPAAITTAIDDVETAGASVFAALVVVALPFILFRLVRKIRG